MHKRFPSFLLIVILSPLLLQCVASQQEVQSISVRARTLNNRIMELEQKMDGLESSADRNATKDRVDQVQKKQAQLASTLERLETEFLQIKGMMEENTHFFRNIQKDTDTFGDSFQGQLAKLNAQLAEQRGKIDILSQQVADNSERIDKFNKAQAEASARQAVATAKAAAEEAARAAREAADKAARLAAEKAAKLAAEKSDAASTRQIAPDQFKKKVVEEEKPKPQKSTASAKSVQISGSTSGGNDLYEKGLALFKEKKYQQAYNAFNTYVSKHPKGEMVPNARFWLGDSLYNQNEFELAILEYQKVIADNPEHPKASAALLKQGFAFEKLDDPLTAKIIYQKLLKEYPKSEQKSTAEKRIEALK